MKIFSACLYTLYCICIAVSSKTRQITKPVLLTLLFLMSSFFVYSNIVHVTVNGAGNHSGTSWANACTFTEAAWNSAVQYAANAGISQAGDEVWLAAGTYGGNRDKPGYVVSCNWYGGFAGNETTRSQRNPAVNITRVVNQNAPQSGGNLIVWTTGNTTVDGITFVNDLVKLSSGGGGNNTATNCVFDSSNIQMNGATFVANYCIFENGPSLDFEIYPAGSFNNCVFQNLQNSSSQGGGAVYTNGPLSVYRCVFINNKCTNWGGAISCDGVLICENSLFIHNSAGTNGGAIYAVGNKFYNNTFVDNSVGTGGLGSAVYDKGGVKVANNIMWGNSGSNAAFYSNSYSGADNFYNNISQDGSANGLMIDPKLDTDYTLSNCSPAINAGNNSYTDGQATDLAGAVRLANGTVDIGCYEHQGAYLGNVQLTASATSMCYEGLPLLLQYTSSYTGPSTYYWYTNSDIFTTTVPQFTVYPTPDDTSFYVTQVTGLGCTVPSAPVHITVYPTPVPATIWSPTPPVGDTVCVGTNISAGSTWGTGGSPGCSDYFRYCTDGGNIWQTYVPGNIINTNNAYGSVLIQTRRGGCTNCPYTDWQTIGSWPVKQIITPTVDVIGSNVLAQGFPATFHSSITYGGTAPVYSWTLNGIAVGTNSATYTVNAPADGDVLICTLTSNYAGCLSATTARDTVILSVSTDYITSPNLCITQPMTVHYNTTPAVVYWQHYNNDPDTAYATWAQAGTTVVNNTGSFAGICTDAQSNIYVADAQHNVVLKYAPGQSTGVVVAGNSVSGAGSGADQLNGPAAVFVDASNNLYVLDAGNYRVQKWASGASSGTTVAGGNGRGIGANQFWSNANSITVTRFGSIYVNDPGNGRIQMWSNGASTGLTAAANLNGATAIAVDDRGTSDTLYIADATGEVLKQAYGASSGVVVAGGHGTGSAANQLSAYIPAIYRTLLGDLYIADRNNGRVQLWHKGATSGVTVAGIDGYGYLPTQLGDATGLALDNAGDIYVSQSPVAPSTATLVKFASQFTDTTYLPYESGYYSALVFTFNGVGTQTNTLIINDAVTPSVSITTNNTVICQGGSAEFVPAPVNGGTAPLYRWYANGILADSTTGNWVTGILHAGDSVYCQLVSNEVCLTANTTTSNSITMQPFVISVNIVAEPANAVCQGQPVTFISRTQNGGSLPSFTWQVNGVIYGNDSILTYANPQNNDVVQCIFTSSSACSAQPTDSSNKIVTKVSSTSLYASGTCTGSVLTDSSAVVPSLLQWLRNDTVVRNVIPQWNSTGTQLLNNVYGSGIFRDGGGNIYLSYPSIPAVKKYAPGDNTGVTVAGGNGLGFTGNQMYNPAGIYVDTMGNIYVADDYRVTKWSPLGIYLGTVAGGSSAGTGANQFDGAVYVYIDKDGNLYVCDANNERVQKFTPGSTNGVTVAGGNGYGNAANQLSYVQGVDVDAAGNVYAADYNNDRVQKWAPGATVGVTVAGGNGRGTAPNQLYAPANVHVDGAGNIFVTQANGAIALWQPGATVGTTILSGTNASASSINSTGDIFVNDRNDGRIVEYTVCCMPDTISANLPGIYTARTISFSGCSITTNADTIFQTQTPSVSIASDQGDTVCSGRLVTFSATALNAGPSPVYLWTKNSLPVGDSSAVYIANYVLQHDTIKCTVLANNVCQTTSSAHSNTLIMYARQPVYGTGTAFINPGDTLYFGGQIITDSGTYVLTLASVYDCDSIVTTHYNLCTPIRDTVRATICSGDSFPFQGRELFIAGNYSDTLQNINGCDSIVTLALSVMPINNYTFSHSICSNESFAFGGHVLTAAGTYTDTLTTHYGCDSIITLNLTVRPTASSGFNQSICAGSTYNFNGQTLSVSGAYYDTLTSINGCDSIVTLNLSVLPVASSTLHQSICPGSSYNFNGQVLNAAGIYYDTLTSINSCDSIVTLNLAVFPVAASTLNHSICPGSTYNFNGHALSAAGVYYDTLTSVNGCDSIVTLNLAVNSILHDTLNQSICAGSVYTFNGVGLSVAGTYYDTLMASAGCDSVVVLKLSLIPATGSSFSHTICSGSSYSFGGHLLTTAGTYRDTLTSASGCDSIVTLNLALNSILHDTLNQSICAGSVYLFNGTGLSVAGIYHDTLTANGGCDSVVVLKLSLIPAASSSFSQTICAGANYSFGGHVLTTAGTYRDTLTSANGCDSIVTLNLAVNSILRDTLNQSICAGSVYTFNGTGLSVAGIYHDTLTTSGGCDSVVVLKLTILPTTSSAISRNICTGSAYNFNGQMLNAAGIYHDTLTSINGCDSIVTLNLTVNSILYDTLNQSICAGTVYQFNGTGLSVAGTYNDTLIASGGCDSVVVLNLSLIPVTSSSISQTICSGSSYTFGGHTLTTSGTYIDTLSSSHGCDSIVTLTLSVSSINDTATVSGAVCSASATGAGYQWINCTTGVPVANATSQTYTAVQNADYACIVTQGNCTDTTNCVSVTGLGINETELYSFDIYPNPTSGTFTVQHNYNGKLTLQLIDELGRKVKEFSLSRPVEQFDITDMAGGLYQAFIFNGVQVVSIVKVIKQ